MTRGLPHLGCFVVSLRAHIWPQRLYSYTFLLLVNFICRLCLLFVSIASPDKFWPHISKLHWRQAAHQILLLLKKHIVLCCISQQWFHLWIDVLTWRLPSLLIRCRIGEGGINHLGLTSRVSLFLLNWVWKDHRVDLWNASAVTSVFVLPGSPAARVNVYMSSRGFHSIMLFQPGIHT